MALALYDGSDEFFDIFGKLAYAAAGIDGSADTARTRLLTVITAFESAPDDLATNAIIAEANRAAIGFDAAAASALGTVRSICRNYLAQLVENDTDQSTVALNVAVEELITQMRAQSETIQANAVAAVVTDDIEGDGVLVVSLKRGDGLTQEHCYAETISVLASDDNGRSMRATGFARVDVMSPSWPQGSGASTTLTAITADASLVTTGGFEDASTLDAHIPKGWILTVGDPGVTIGLTENEEQTVSISGTPTAGYYHLQYTNAAGKTQTTDQLAFNASGSAVQSALRKLAGLNKITVSSTGTTPNFTHTITFSGVGGNVALLSAINQMSGASAVNEQQRISLSNTDGGTFTLSWNGSTTVAIDYDATSSEIDAALEALGNIASGDLTCAGGPLPSSPINVTFGGTLAGANQPQMTINTSNLTRTSPSVAIATVTAGAGATNEVQTLTITGATGGTYTLTYSGQTTSALAYNANASAIDTALEALSNIGTGDVTVAGTGPFTITFGGTLAATNVPQITVDYTGLTPTGFSADWIVEAWKLEEVSGEDRASEIGNTPLIEIGGTVSNEIGVSGDGALFDTVAIGLNTGSLSVPEVAALQLPSQQSRSISFWVSIPTGSDFLRMAWSVSSLHGGHGLSVDVNGSTAIVTAITDSGTAAASTGSMSTNAWNLICLRWDGSSVGISRNGAAFTESAISGSISATNAGLKVLALGQESDIQLDELTLWKVAISDDLAAAIWNDGSGRFYPFAGLSGGGASATIVTTTQGDPGTNEVQTVTLGNSPNAGTFTLSHSTVESDPIPYNASASEVATILNDMGIATFSVSGSAGGPWSVTFGGSKAATNVAEFTSDASGLSNAQPSGSIATITHGSPDSGSITINETQAGDTHVYQGGRAMWYESNGSELTELTYKLTLSAKTVYALNCWLQLSATDSAGVIKIELVDGVSGTVMQDDQGAANAITVNLDDLTTDWQSLSTLVTSPFFRTPTKLPALVMLRLRFSTAPSSGTVVYFDELALAAATELYAGGPFAALFAGADPFRIEDSFAIAVTNNRAGDVHEWANRFFGLGAARLLLPSVSSSPTIPDTVIG